MISRTSYVLLLALMLAACGGGGERKGVVPRDRFVAANVALRMLPATATEAERKAVLKKFGVTDRQMLAWVDAHRNDPGALAEAWEQVAKRVDSLSALRPAPPKADSARRDSMNRLSPPVLNIPPPALNTPAPAFDSLSRRVVPPAPAGRPGRATPRMQ
ncbi:MAG TPA: hypothetical protein VF665_23270 [Longimicrobium sp.]|uniref:hypothetical protein n=1 Tax=Longimicrobium sp. TaxID=2029185 RepID=UPI002EDADF9F